MLRATLIACLALCSAGCAEPMDHETPPPATPPAAKNYFIDLKAAHSHIYRQVAQLFTVYDLDGCTVPADLTTCPKVPGLPVRAFYRVPGSTTLFEQDLEPGKLEDNQDGTYVLYTAFGGYGSHVVGLRFAKDGQEFFNAFPLETSRGGGEKYLCDSDADGTKDFVFMVRWNANTSRILANGTATRFTLELMRSINTPVNLTEPWTNTFDHLAPAALQALPEVKLKADPAGAATEVATLTPVYKGKGIYEVAHTFAASDLAGVADRLFRLDVTFTDTAGCQVLSVEADEDFRFPVYAAP